MTEWVLIIWIFKCGFASCHDDNVQQFGVFETRADCERALTSWQTDENGYRDGDHRGKCISRPVQ